MMMLTTMTAWAQTTVTYIDMDGQQQSVTEYTEVTTDMTADGNGYIYWSSGTYVVKSSVTLSGCIRYDGEVIDLIVCDGATLTVNGSSNGAFDGNTLNIYAQSNGTGMGVVNVKKHTKCGHLNIAGGKVTLDADGKSYGLYVFDGDANGLTVNGGDVTIQNSDGSQGAIFFAGNGFVTLNGGKLTVTNSMGNGYKAIEGQYTNTINFNGGTAVINGRIFNFQTINLNSGNVTVNGEILNVWGYTVTYDFTHATDSYYIKAFSNNLNPSATRTVQVKDGVSFRCNGKSYSGTLSDDDISAISDQTMTPDISNHFSVNDAGTEYTIHTAKGWGLFCDALQDNDTYNRFSGKTVKLGNNIGTAQAPITRMAGSSYHDFCGTFDGGGHTLTVNISSDDITDGSTQYVAPFRYVSNTKADPSDEADSPAAFRNLHVTGTITTDKQFTGGLIGGCWGNVSIENCRVSVTIQSTISGDGTHGGIVGIQQNGALTITGCLFDGRLLGATTYAVGGFLGYRRSAAEIRNSLFAPAEVTVMNTSGATFARNTVDTYNCYYTTLLNDGTNYAPAYVGGTETPNLWRNGKALHTVTAAADVTIEPIALTGTATQYDVSGITAYSGGGLQLGQTLYYGSGDAVSLTLSNTATGAPLGYQYAGYTASAGTLSGSTLTMPDVDVTISAALAPIDWATVNQGDSEDPYMIYNKDQLLLLAHRVNGTNGETANTYQGKYFKLGADITFSHPANEGDDYDENYEAIGHYDGIHVFNGNFNGDGHTVSGIRINKTDSDDANKCQALFGQTDSDADIHDVHLTDARITGYDYVAGIVAYNYGTVSGCTVTDSYITYNAFDRGTICARNAGTLTNNYYHGCTVNGTPVTSGVGCGYINNGNTTTDITANNGAVPGYFLTLGEGITIAGGATTFTIPARGETAEVTYHVAAAGANVTLSYSGTIGDGYQLGIVSNDGNGSNAATADGSGNYTAVMPAADATAKVTAIPWNGKGTEDSPYIIEYASQLDLLAHRVNGTHGETANDYYNTYFQLAKDISYPYTSAWNDFTSDENNYEAIGGSYDAPRYFRGHFDGNNKTISGIRIYKDGHSSTNMYQGIFGRTDSGADIHDLTLADARITGYDITGGIVGRNYGGTVTRCHALSNVNVHAERPDANYHGGIAGDNWGTIEQCTSAATLTTADADNSYYYGGIAGYNYGTLRDNLAIGATVPAAKDNSYGAITGRNIGTLQRNYYAACKVNDTPNATGVGCGSIGNADDGYTTADVNNDNNPDGAVSIHTLALALADAADNTAAIADHAGQTLAVALSGRTLYKDGAWNTLCLPFSLGDAEAADGHHFDGTPLEGADVMELDTEGSYEGKTTGLDNGTLYLYFKKANTIAAGTPYIVKWGDKDEPSTLEGLTDIVNPVFTNVTVSNANNDVAFTGGAFKGTYASITYTEENKSILFVGGNNSLYWPTADASIGAQRAYFELNDGQQARNIVLNFDNDNATGIHSTTNCTRSSLLASLAKNCTNLAGAWYTLDGRKLAGKPSAPGIYVKDGHKVAIKREK